MRRNTILLIIFITFITFLIAFELSNRTSGGSEQQVDITTELETIGLEDVQIEMVNASNCEMMDKRDGIWTIKRCSDDLYFKVFLEEGEYTFGACTKWTTEREAFLKLANVLPIKECKNTDAEDSFDGQMGSIQIYNVCGLRVFFRDDCIVGVGL